MLPQILSALMGLIFPKAPDWIARFVGLVIPAVFEIVDELSSTDLEGSAKFRLASEAIGQAIDSAFDELPAWSELSEERRDIVIAGLIELAVFIQELASGDEEYLPVKNRTLRKGVRRAIKTLKQELR